MKNLLLISIVSSIVCSTSSSSTPISIPAQAISKRRDFPPSPPGATFEQFKPCDSSSRTIPVFVNSAWTTDPLQPSSATHAFIVQHGLGRDFNTSFSDVSDLIGPNRVLVAPNFYKKSDSSLESTNWYQPSINLGWKESNSWVGGYDSVDAECSTYDVYDSLTSNYLRKDLYPNLEKLYYLGHSDGGAFISRYSLISEETTELEIRYIEANAPSHAYLTSNRPSDMDCSGYDNWEYGVHGTLPRYVQDHFRTSEEIFRRYVSRDVVSLTGDLDTYKNGPFGDQSCKAQKQGGVNRRDRNYAQWAYKNLLAGTSEDVSDYYGYKELKTSHGGVESLDVGTFNHRNCIVAGVGHYAPAMFGSDCGMASLFSDQIPKGSPPDRPDESYDTPIVEIQD